MNTDKNFSALSVSTLVNLYKVDFTLFICKYVSLNMRRKLYTVDYKTGEYMLSTVILISSFLLS
jgi:hypothetical protein